MTLPMYSVMLLHRTSEMCIYYTDGHEVDEDKTTICKCGGGWYSHIEAGIMDRDTFLHSSQVWDPVASSNMKNSQIIRIITMSTKMSGLSVVVAGNGYSQSGQVLHLDIWTIVHPLYRILLLRRAYKNMELYGLG